MTRADASQKLLQVVKPRVPIESRAEAADKQRVSARAELAIYASAFFSLSFAALLGLAVPLWTVFLHASPSATGLVLGAQAILPLGLSIHVGALMDRTDVRRVMLVLATVTIILPLLYPLLPWISALFVLQLLMGFTYQVSWLGAQTVIGQTFPGDARHYGRFSSVAGLGMFVAPLLDGFGWSLFGPWGAFGLMSLWSVALMVAVLALPDSGSRASAPIDWRRLLPDLESYAAALKLIKIPAVTLVVLATFLRLSASTVRSTFYGVYLSRDAHFSGSAIGALLGFGALLGSPGALLATAVIRCCGSPRRALLWSVALALVAIAITPLMTNFWMLAGAMGLFGVGLGVNQPILLAILSSAAGFEYQGASTGLRSTANLLATLTIPAAMGFISEWSGIRNGFYIIGAILLAATATVALITRAPAQHPVADVCAGRGA